jgi:hypothetical protein
MAFDFPYLLPLLLVFTSPPYSSIVACVHIFFPVAVIRFTFMSLSPSSSSLAPELLYAGYSLAFPFIAYYLFDVAHKHHRKEWQTNLICFGFLVSILYSWMYILGPRVYIFLYPIICVAGIVPLLKLLALEFHCLSSDMDSHIRASFWNYYLYLVTPSEV